MNYEPTFDDRIADIYIPQNETKMFSIVDKGFGNFECPFCHLIVKDNYSSNPKYFHYRDISGKDIRCHIKCISKELREEILKEKIIWILEK